MGQASGLTVHVMDTGRDLIELSLTLECTLSYKKTEKRVRMAPRSCITSFQTINDAHP